MSKKFLWRLLFSLGILIVAVLWLLKILVPETFGFYSVSLGVLILTAFFGVVFWLRGIFEKETVTIKKGNILIGVVFLIGAAVMLIPTLALPDGSLGAVIVTIIALALLFSVISVSGKKWDSGDNQKAGYKKYSERKKDK